MKKISTKLGLRVAAGCMLFFAAGHSVGHITRDVTRDAEVARTIDLMRITKRDMFGQMRSFDENYEGMSINLIVVLLALTVILWILGRYTKDYPKVVKSLLWPIAFVIAGFSVTAWLFFFPLPAITCLVALLIVVWVWFSL